MHLFLISKFVSLLIYSRYYSAVMTASTVAGQNFPLAAMAKMNLIVEKLQSMFYDTEGFVEKKVQQATHIHAACPTVHFSQKRNDFLFSRLNSGHKKGKVALLCQE